MWNAYDNSDLCVRTTYSTRLNYTYNVFLAREHKCPCARTEAYCILISYPHVWTSLSVHVDIVLFTRQIMTVRTCGLMHACGRTPYERERYLHRQSRVFIEKHKQVYNKFTTYLVTVIFLQFLCYFYFFLLPLAAV